MRTLRENRYLMSFERAFFGSFRNLMIFIHIDEKCFKREQKHEILNLISLHAVWKRCNVCLIWAAAETRIYYKNRSSFINPYPSSILLITQVFLIIFSRWIASFRSFRSNFVSAPDIFQPKNVFFQLGCSSEACESNGWRTSNLERRTSLLQGRISFLLLW